MKNDPKEMRSQIIPFIMLVPNYPFYNVGAKLSGAKLSALTTMVPNCPMPNSVGTKLSKHLMMLMITILRRNYDGYSCKDGRQVWLER